jgi:hypothetical protein
VPAGDLYYVSYGVAFGAGLGEFVAATGGVSSDATVTLTETDRIVVT